MAGLGPLLCRFAGLAILLPVLLLLPGWSQLRQSQCWFVHAGAPERGYDPAPTWFVPALRSLPRRELSTAELELLDKDGVVPVPGLVSNEGVLGELRRLFTHKYDPRHLWRYNGVMNALIRHSPLPSVASASLGGKPVTIWNAQVEPRPARSERWHPYLPKPWQEDTRVYGHPLTASLHDDTGFYSRALHRNGHSVIPLSSIFLALTDIPHGLKFIAGSHVLNSKHRCPPSNDVPGAQDCFDRLWNESFGERSWDLKAGDAVLFWGEVYHWTQLTENARQALSIRYIPADMAFKGGTVHADLADMAPPLCAPLGGSPGHPVLHPPPKSVPGIDPGKDAHTGQDRWPLWPRCPEFLDVPSMRRWIRASVLGRLPWTPECGKGK